LVSAQAQPECRVALGLAAVGDRESPGAFELVDDDSVDALEMVPGDRERRAVTRLLDPWERIRSSLWFVLAATSSCSARSSRRSSCA